MERLTEWYDDGEYKGILVKENPTENSPKTLYQKFGEQNDYSDCAEGYLGMEKLKDYEDADEQGLLLRLPCNYNESLFWIVNGHIKEVWFKGIRCDKGYKPQIIARYMVGLSAKEEPITKLENIGKTVFLTKKEAELALEESKGV